MRIPEDGNKRAAGQIADHGKLATGAETGHPGGSAGLFERNKPADSLQRKKVASQRAQKSDGAQRAQFRKHLDVEAMANVGLLILDGIDAVAVLPDIAIVGRAHAQQRMVAPHA